MCKLKRLLVAMEHWSSKGIKEKVGCPCKLQGQPTFYIYLNNLILLLKGLKSYTHLSLTFSSFGDISIYNQMTKAFFLKNCVKIQLDLPRIITANYIAC